jgi:hypothetical protein
MELWRDFLHTRLQRAIDYVSGYDFFISYSHEDGLTYPIQLKQRLEQAGFKVFLDQTGYVAGDPLRRETRRQVFKSRKIVIIARPVALQSPWVKYEVDVALAMHRTPIIIDINDAVMTARADAAVAAMTREHEWLRLPERLGGGEDVPTAHTISELVRSFGATRQETKRQRVFASAAVIFAAAAVIAASLAVIAVQARNLAKASEATAKANEAEDSEMMSPSIPR